jgi:hypothetical protein
MTIDTTRFDPEIRVIHDELRRADGDEDGSFGRVVERFIDLMNLPGFMEVGVPAVRRDVIDAVLANVALLNPTERVLGETFDVALVRHDGTDLHHGAVELPWGRCGFFWFDDDGLGLTLVPRVDGSEAVCRLALVSADAESGTDSHEP